jgi:hypothetical protein
MFNLSMASCVHLLQREKIRTVSEKTKFLFSVRGVQLVSWGEEAANDGAVSSTRGALHGGQAVRSKVKPGVPVSIHSSRLFLATDHR